MATDREIGAVVRVLREHGWDTDQATIERAARHALEEAALIRGQEEWLKAVRARLHQDFYELGLRHEPADEALEMIARQ